ncbi:aquaporin-10a [Acanthochromis polyacanthus]|uniref:Aquaporin 10a n=1 Tax=Acanthochromis polyacanthus TaxID=80966 RepID=A0A3Q1EE80_9TELE|nr:aquaporin-10a [Acanthochromis polyacanthus]
MKFSRRVKSALVRECMAEVLGTFVLVFFGEATAAQARLSKNTESVLFSANFAFPVGVIAGMYLTMGISGAHLNPAVTLSFCVLGRWPWRKLLPYSLSQILGAYLAAGVVFLVYYEAIMDYSGGVLSISGPNETATIFFTSPSEYLTLGRSVLDQVVGTAMLMLCILPLGEKRNTPAPNDLIPVVVGVIVFGLSISVGGNCMGAINPARDFGPRLLTLTVGYGIETFTCYNYWFWVPLVVPNVGGVLGTFIYLLFIQWQLPDPEPPEDSSNLFTISDKLKQEATTWDNGDKLKAERL